MSLPIANAKLTLDHQVSALSRLPGVVMERWPAIFALAVVNTGTSYAVKSLESMGWARNMIVKALIKSFGDVVVMTGWDLTKGVR